MDIAYDPGKCLRNVAERGLSFELAREFDWSGALVVEDLRRDYGERRFQALGYLNERLHMLVFTPRKKTIHVISLRRANAREAGKYDQANRS